MLPSLNSHETVPRQTTLIGNLFTSEVNFVQNVHNVCTVYTVCTVSPRMFVLFVWGWRVYLFHNVCLRFQASGTGAAALPAALNRKLTAFHQKRKFSPSAEAVGTTIPTGSGSHPAGSKLNSTRTWLHCTGSWLQL